MTAIILAAGGSSRLGSPKQLAVVGGEQLLDRAVRVASEAGLRPLVVLGAGAEQVREHCALDGLQVIVNEDWASGMASSIRAGVLALKESGRGAVILACDQPAVTAKHLRLLVETGLATEGAVASAYAGRRGIPAYFPGRILAQLTQLAGDTGARALLQEGVAVPLARGELDVDTVETLREACDWTAGEAVVRIPRDGD